ncbi:hypothetical protein AAU57_00910 [Nonlabens sp. YIK11]|uniref:DUF3095 domain-containing protein n=1 Tax=Nonlabens sp. YIK11 TaxID=1453349 RepID=UPI0006DC7F3D|nr:DUF3095 domain-containing protein [Nonlabens sp. YIK11]KQC32041.1 hypothetical protein AAU57_00910 [Nonlabens sp. YIK11]
MNSTRHFYAQLKAKKKSLQYLVRQPRNFTAVPADWHVVVADVQNSTQAVENGMHNNVNLAATGSVVAVLNSLKTDLHKHEIPYFFGGDGVTFLIPDDYLEKVMSALETYKKHVFKNLKLKLKVGALSVREIYHNNLQIKILKSKVNPHLTIPIVLGNGIKYAEKYIKKEIDLANAIEDSTALIDLTGMECRWDQISPRDEKNKVVCLLVHCEDESQQESVYADILDIITLVFGSLEERQPITVKRLKLKATIRKIRKEMVARIGRNDLTYLVKHWLITYFGKFYFAYFKEGKEYLNKVSQLSDTIMFDGSLNTVMEGDADQIERLTNYLDLLEREGKIKYGIHSTYASVMSCYVQDRRDNHIHFVDATEGGYTSAAVIFKSKFDQELELDLMY